MSSLNFGLAGKKPHDGVGLDGSFRVGSGQGVTRPTIPDAEIAKTAGVPKEYHFPVLTNAVRQACQSNMPLK